MRTSMRAWWAWFALTALAGCGDNTSVAVCFGDVAFCNNTFNPVARPGPDQTVASGDLVVLDGSNSSSNGGSIRSFSWTQTSGPTVSLTGADTERATFVAPDVTSEVASKFRLTVVNGANRADSASTAVTIRPRAAVALETAVSLFDGALQPAAAPAPVFDGCAPATAGLSEDQSAAQIGLWLAARSIAIAKGVDTTDPSAFFDAARVLVGQTAGGSAAEDVAAQIESFGFVVLAALAKERDPALAEAVAARVRGLPAFGDPAALLNGRSEVTDIEGLAIAPVTDPAAATERAVERLLAARSRCVDNSQALALTAAGWRVIAAAAIVGD
jgi:K319L-like, PKD domain